MELSPQAVAAATFRTVKRGYDPDEVRAYLIEVSASLEASHQQATAMEARARAAIAKLQDATQQAQHAQQGGSATVPAVPAEEAETISRTLLLAQRTADLTVADAKAQAAAMTQAAAADAASVTSAAKLEAAATLEQARAEAARLLDDARSEAHRVKSEEHLRVESEVRELTERREALLTDLDTLGRLGAAHRAQLRDIGARLGELADGVPLSVELPEFAAPPTARPFADPTPSGGLPRPVSTFGAMPLGDDSGGLSMPPPISGQVPLQPGVEPLVSPRPTSADEVRSLWQQAEEAERAQLAREAGTSDDEADGSEADGSEADGSEVDGTEVDLGAADTTADAGAASDGESRDGEGGDGEPQSGPGAADAAGHHAGLVGAAGLAATPDATADASPEEEDEDDATPVDALALDGSTPAEGIRR